MALFVKNSQLETLKADSRPTSEANISCVCVCACVCLAMLALLTLAAIIQCAMMLNSPVSLQQTIW